MKLRIYLAIAVCVFLFVTGSGLAQENGGEANTCEAGNDMHFPAKVLLGKLPKTGGASTLFIDPVGVPVTPGSVAGVKRRTRRRTVAVGTAAVASSASKNSAQQQPATATESVEDRLRTLDKLAAGGYITKQEYDARKKAILEGL